MTPPPDPGVAGAAVDVVAGFVGGLLSGYVVARTQVAYQLRADKTNEVRELALEAQRTFRAWIARPAYYGGERGRGRGDYHRGDAVGEKIDALSAHFTVHARWLDDTSQEAVKRIWEGLGQHFSVHMEACFVGDQMEEHRTALAAEEWLTRDFDRLLDKVQALPWYLRMFGR